MREEVLQTPKGDLVYLVPNYLQVMRAYRELLTKLNDHGGANEASADEYVFSALELLDQNWDFSKVEGVNSFEEALYEDEVVEVMIGKAGEFITKMGEVFRKKMQSPTPTTPTQKASKGKKSKASSRKKS